MQIKKNFTARQHIAATWSSDSYRHSLCMRAVDTVFALTQDPRGRDADAA